MSLRITSLVLIIALAPMRKAWSDNWNLELLGREPSGPTYNAHVANNRAYLCAGGIL